MGALGYESHGWTQKQCMGTQKWLRRPWFGPYGREISPNMMFCKTKVKWPQRGLDGHGADCMGAFGYIFTGGHKNKRKWGLKIGDQGIFCRCVYGKKTAGSWRGCSRGQRGQSGGFVSNFGSQRTAMHMLQNLNPENYKQQGKKAKRASTNWCRQWFGVAKTCTVVPRAKNTNKSCNKEKKQQVACEGDRMLCEHKKRWIHQ